MTKTQKIIVLVAAVLIVIIWLFPPYWEGEVDSKGKLAGIFLRWDFNRNLRDLLNPPYYIGPDGWKSLEIMEYTTAEDLLVIEYLIVLIIAGTAGYIVKAKIKTHKVIIIAAAFLTVFALIYPPSYSKLTDGNWINPGWKFIVNLVDHPANAPKIRFGILTLEIFGILVLAGATLLIAGKRYSAG
jgi:hypothetical protein